MHCQCLKAPEPAASAPMDVDQEGAPALEIGERNLDPCSEDYLSDVVGEDGKRRGKK